MGKVQLRISDIVKSRTCDTVRYASVAECYSWHRKQLHNTGLPTYSDTLGTMGKYDYKQVLLKGFQIEVRIKHVIVMVLNPRLAMHQLTL